MFFVDGEMRLSDQLPTTVDFTNILVNYLEVSPDELSQSLPTVPIDIPSKTAPAAPHLKPASELRAPPGVYPPQVLPPTPELRSLQTTPPPPSQSAHIAPAPARRYHSQIPKYLSDLDAPEDSPLFSRANAVVQTTPTPPTLPMFLNKSILNGNTPMKDDSSVLIMPNHTVLNHLTTSSIRQGVLATSATTRYKRKVCTLSFHPVFRLQGPNRVCETTNQKTYANAQPQFLTTIMYKPTSETGD